MTDVQVALVQLKRVGRLQARIDDMRTEAIRKALLAGVSYREILKFLRQPEGGDPG